MALEESRFFQHHTASAARLDEFSWTQINVMQQLANQDPIVWLLNVLLRTDQQ